MRKITYTMELNGEGYLITNSPKIEYAYDLGIYGNIGTPIHMEIVTLRNRVEQDCLQKVLAALYLDHCDEHPEFMDHVDDIFLGKLPAWKLVGVQVDIGKFWLHYRKEDGGHGHASLYYSELPMCAFDFTVPRIDGSGADTINVQFDAKHRPIITELEGRKIREIQMLEYHATDNAEGTISATVSEYL